jgi:hypothetical protein
MSLPVGPQRRFDGRHYLNRPGCGLDTLRHEEHEAEQASAILRDRTLEALTRFEDIFGLKPGEGKVLLLDTGVKANTRRLARTLNEANAETLALIEREETELLARVMAESTSPELLVESGQ